MKLTVHEATMIRSTFDMAARRDFLRQVTAGAVAVGMVGTNDGAANAQPAAAGEGTC